MKRKISYLILLILFSSFIFARDFYITPISDQDSNNVITDSYVNSIVTKAGVEISLITVPCGDSKLQVFVDIRNHGSETFSFNENSIYAYEGDYDNPDWHNIEYVPAEQYYEDAVTQTKVRTVFAAVGLGLAAIDAGLAPDPFDNSILPVPVPVPAPLPAPVPVPVPVPDINDDTLLVGAGVINLFETLDENKNTLEYLDKHLLYSAEIGPNEGYSGVFFLPESKGPDYQISIKVAPDEVLRYYFTRSDKYEILHRWDDPKSPRYALTFSTGFPYCYSGGLYIIYAGIPVGGYGAVSGFYKPLNNDDAISGVVLDGGVDVKLFSHTWGLFGITSDFGTYGYDKATGEEKTYIAFGPEIGLNHIFYWIDFGYVFKYKILKGCQIDLMFGFSFD